MSRINHDRPVLKVIDAGGGERIRTIAEDLRAAQAADRSSARRGEGQLRCGKCRATKKVVLPYRRCRGCLADEEAIAKARRHLRGLSAGAAAAASGQAGAKYRRSIAAAEERIAERRRANGGRTSVPTPRKVNGGQAAARRPNVQAAERAAEAARKELLLARTDWEKQILRERHRRAQEALTRAQRLDRQRRSLS